ncbi:MAG TPA: A24 family peptidase [Aggregatilineales bacterium]|nr:A24 family peptidase [Aggregatilineales bacterium]
MIVSILIASLLGLIAGGIVNMLADDLPFTLRVRLPHYPDSRPAMPESPPEPPEVRVEGTEPGEVEKVAEVESPIEPDRENETGAPGAAGESEMVYVLDGPPRPAVAWLGITAFLAGKRVGPGDRKLSWRHPVVEIALALVFAYIVLIPDKTLLTRAFWAGCIAILVLITVIDLEHRLILFSVIIPGCIYSLAGAALVNRDISDQIGFRDYVIGGLIGFGLFTILFVGGLLFSWLVAASRGEPLDEVAFGWGDVMLATLSGFMLGWQALIFAVFIAVFAGAIGALVYLVARFVTGGKYDPFAALPYGQYIVLGTLIMMLWREPVVHFLQGR